MTEEERKAEVCELWRQQSLEMRGAETGYLEFYKILADHYPALLPRGQGDKYQLLRAELLRCSDC
jgi:hypothetical protein